MVQYKLAKYGIRRPIVSRVERKKQMSEAEKQAALEQKAAIKARREAKKAEAKANKAKTKRSKDPKTEATGAASGSGILDTIKQKFESIKEAIKAKWNQFKEWFKQQERWKQIAIMVGTSIVTLLLIIVIVVFGIFSSIFGDIFKASPDDYDLSLTAVDGYYNILLLGVDSRDMKDLEGTRSDAIMVVSISEDTSDVKILSVYRDTYLKMGETSTYDKITHSCVYGGPEMTMKSLNQALDLNISNYVVVNFKAVADLVDAVGGIEVNVEDYEIEQLNKYTIETANNIGCKNYKLVKKAGVQTLEGCQAVSYSRIRKGVGDDFKRTERMRTVVSLTMEKMKDMSFRDLRKMVKLLTPQVQTNISMRNVLALAIRLPQYNIIGTEGWPYHVTTGFVGGVSYVFPSDLADNTISMHQKFFGQTDYEPSSKVYEISNQIIADIQAERDSGALEGEEDLNVDTSHTTPPPVTTPDSGTSSSGDEGSGNSGDSGNTGSDNEGSGDTGTGEGSGDATTPGSGEGAGNEGEGAGDAGTEGSGAEGEGASE